MKRLLSLAAVVFAIAISLAACGGGVDGGRSSSASSGSKGTATTVSTKRIDGKSVLVDADGKALYTSDEEADGRVRCTDDACRRFWQPLTIQGGQPTGNVNGGTLGVLQRSDGKMQVTFNGAPVYRFAEDQSGTLNADGLTDAFGGQQFTWHAVTAGGGSQAPATTSGSSRGTPGY
jgi:predicted lipoprotein with Yx(FWY)xxD motif